MKIIFYNDNFMNVNKIFLFFKLLLSFSCANYFAEKISWSIKFINLLKFIINYKLLLFINLLKFIIFIIYVKFIKSKLPLKFEILI